MAWLIQVKGAVTGREIYIALSISSRSRSAHPDPPFLAIRGRIIDPDLPKCSAIVGVADHPTMVGVCIAKRSPCDVDNTMLEQQRGTLVGLPAIKGYQRGYLLALVIARSFDESENSHRAPWLVFTCRDIEGVQSLHIAVARFPGHGHHIHSVGSQVNGGGCSNTNIWMDILIRILQKNIRSGDSGHCRGMEKARLP